MGMSMGISLRLEQHCSACKQPITEPIRLRVMTNDPEKMIRALATVGICPQCRQVVEFPSALEVALKFCLKKLKKRKKYIWPTGK